MKSKFLLLLPYFFLVGFLLTSLGAIAQGDLMVLPKRLVFDGSQRSQEINLANTGKDTAVYAVSFINYKMTETGSFEQIETPEEGQRFAEDFLRFFPRRVTLAPNEAQTIRVQLTRTGALEEGEYRSHMYFRAVEDQMALGEEDSDISDIISIQIKTVFGISIPIIVRRGESTSKVTMSNIYLSLEDQTPNLSITFNREGNMSVYGDIYVEHISNKGITTRVGLIKGISVYTPNSKRVFTMNLKSDEINFEEGKLKVTYKAESGEKLASSELTLNSSESR